MNLPPGTRVRHARSGWTGTVLRHVAGADGGSYRVQWDRTGASSLVAPVLLQPIDRARD